MIKKVYCVPKKLNKKTTDKEFKKWLEIFMKENGEILDELAVC